MCSSDLIPRKNRIRLTHYKSPVNSADILLFQHRHNHLEEAAIAARHILCTNQWPAVFLQIVNQGNMFFDIAILVIRNHIRVLQLKLIQLCKLRAPAPKPRRQRLRWIYLTCPRKYTLQQRQALFMLLVITRLVIKIPQYIQSTLSISTKGKNFGTGTICSFTHVI